MNTGHVDASHGATGDAWLGALIDAGASLQQVQVAVDALGFGGVRLAYAKVTRDPGRASLVRVRAPAGTHAITSWEQLERLLEFAAIDDEIRAHAIGVLHRVVSATAICDGIGVEQVRFHELEAMTMLGDVVGTCAAIVGLGLQGLTVGHVAVGVGRTHTVHGDLPLPDPRVARILAGHMTTPGDRRDVEVTTPVGAALVAHFCRPAERVAAGDARWAVGAGSNGTRMGIELDR